MFGEDCGLQTEVQKLFSPSTFEDCVPPIFCSQTGAFHTSLSWSGTLQKDY